MLSELPGFLQCFYGSALSTVVPIVVQFLLGQLCVTTESVVDVLVAADMLGVHGAVTVCTNLLAEVLTPWNVLGVWELAARTGGCGLLVEQCAAFVEEKFLEVVQVGICFIHLFVCF